MLLPLQRGTAGSIRKHILSSLRQAKGDLDTIQDVLEKSTDLGVLATGLTALQDALVQVGHGVLGLIDLSNAKGKKQMGAPSPQLRSLVRAWKAWELGQDMRENP
jgi:DNA-binding FrmR family transcriptional regulator